MIRLGEKKNTDLVRLVISYDDEFGNKYETRATIDLENKKIVRQEYKTTREVKKLLKGEASHLVIDTNMINWEEVVEAIKTREKKLTIIHLFVGLSSIILLIITLSSIFSKINVVINEILAAIQSTLIFTSIYFLLKLRRGSTKLNNILVTIPNKS